MSRSLVREWNVAVLFWLLPALAAYAALLAYLYLAQEDLLFPRRAAWRSDRALPKEVERVELVSDGHRLAGHVLRRKGARDAALIFPGNAWDAEDCLMFTAERLPGVDLVAFHYRGYGPSAGRPSESAFVADARAIAGLAIRLLAPRHLLAIGYSIGSGVAAQLAGAGAVAGAVLVTPFDSIEAVARGRYRFAPVGLLLKHKFRSDLALAGKDVPIAIIAAEKDTVVPPERTRALAERLVHPVLVTTIMGAGHGTGHDCPAFTTGLQEAVARLLAAAGAEGRAVRPMAAAQPCGVASSAESAGS